MEQSPSSSPYLSRVVKKRGLGRHRSRWLLLDGDSLKIFSKADAGRIADDSSVDVIQPKHTLFVAFAEFGPHRNRVRDWFVKFKGQTRWFRAADEHDRQQWLDILYRVKTYVAFGEKLRDDLRRGDYMLEFTEASSMSDSEPDNISEGVTRRSSPFQTRKSLKYSSQNPLDDHFVPGSASYGVTSIETPSLHDTTGMEQLPYNPASENIIRNQIEACEESLHRLKVMESEVSAHAKLLADSYKNTENHHDRNEMVETTKQFTREAFKSIVTSIMDASKALTESIESQGVQLDSVTSYLKTYEERLKNSRNMPGMVTMRELFTPRPAAAAPRIALEAMFVRNEHQHRGRPVTNALELAPPNGPYKMDLLDEVGICIDKRVVQRTTYGEERRADVQTGSFSVSPSPVSPSTSAITSMDSRREEYMTVTAPMPLRAPENADDVHRRVEFKKKKRLFSLFGKQFGVYE